MCLTFSEYIHSKYVYEYKNRKRKEREGRTQDNTIQQTLLHYRQWILSACLHLVDSQRVHSHAYRFQMQMAKRS